MSKSPVSVVCDAGPIIHLDELGYLSLLADFSKILIPEQVWQEVEVHRPQALVNPRLPLQRVSVTISSQPAFQTLVRALSLASGEQAALSLVQDHSHALFLTDDAAARLAAVTLAYQVHGSIGILLRAIRRQQLTQSQVVEILRGLPERSTLHIRSGLLQEIINKLESQG
jgi:predicted nucleic acid-binding protein